MKQQLIEASLRRLVAAIRACEAETGCYGHASLHDIACQCDVIPCTCGRDELVGAEEEASRLLKPARVASQSRLEVKG